MQPRHRQPAPGLAASRPGGVPASGAARLAPWLKRREFWLVTAAVAAFFCLVTTLQVRLCSAYAGTSFGWGAAAGSGLVEGIHIAGLAVLVIQLAHYYPIERPVRGRRLLRHFALSVAVGTVLMATQAAASMLIPPVSMPAEMTLPVRFLRFLLSGILPGFILLYWSILAVEQALHFQRRSRRGQLAAARLEARLARERLQRLRSQLEPHFLFNSLNAIATRALDDGSPQTARMIGRLGSLLRLCLAEEGRQLVPLRHELAFVEGYLELEKARLGDRLAVRFEIDPEDGELPIPNLLLQPLVENAVRHGAPGRSPAGGEVTVTALRRDDRLQLEIADRPAAGTSAACASAAPTGCGLSLLNLRQRLSLLYGEHHRFALAPNRQGGTTVTLELPCSATGAPAPAGSWAPGTAA